MVAREVFDYDSFLKMLYRTKVFNATAFSNLCCIISTSKSTVTYTLTVVIPSYLPLADLGKNVNVAVLLNCGVCIQ